MSLGKKVACTVVLLVTAYCASVGVGVYRLKSS